MGSGSLYTVNASGWYTDEVGDFNGDGRTDILWAILILVRTTCG
ncbi:FG-GAP repeat protein [Calothrix rhizosoleniae]